MIRRWCSDEILKRMVEESGRSTGPQQTKTGEKVAEELKKKKKSRERGKGEVFIRWMEKAHLVFISHRSTSQNGHLCQCLFLEPLQWIAFGTQQFAHKVELHSIHKEIQQTPWNNFSIETVSPSISSMSVNIAIVRRCTLNAGRPTVLFFTYLIFFFLLF